MMYILPSLKIKTHVRPFASLFNTPFIVLRLSSHYFDPPKRHTLEEKAVTSINLTLMNQWPFNHSKHIKQE